MTLLVYVLAVFFTQIVADQIGEWGPLTAEGERDQEALGAGGQLRGSLQV